ncbi:SAGA histone acetylase and TREX-2 complexes component [Malassezia obtusa]|uniref:SAGA histone acetylase and TREX-2 complexes component n=1 Tax=Malassezia obtusa TaxID=76774 RepID=A0AAF0IWJ5_9BASI|nr:SAGA histone acetylase and TREX-2 complexes component [Malassezia obtusa]
MSDGGESCEELLNLLHQRLVATGEWNTLLAQLRVLLEESEWDTQLRAQAERDARAQDSLHLPTLVAKLGPYAQSTASAHPETLPDSVREAMSAKIRDFLDRNLEDA